jgi:hypothetical protein
MSDTEKFDSWCVCELFGHQQIAGRVTEASIGGCSFLRVDVPDQPAIPKRDYYGAQDALPAYTRYFGQGAIYALNPCSEAVARRVAERIRAQPPIPFEPIPASRQLGLDSDFQEE